MFVDDLISIFSIASILMSEISKFQTIFVRTEEELQWYLGLRIVFPNGVLFFSQNAYIDKTLNQLNVPQCKTNTTPVTPNFFENFAQYKSTGCRNWAVLHYDWLLSVHCSKRTSRYCAFSYDFSVILISANTLFHELCKKIFWLLALNKE